MLSPFPPGICLVDSKEAHRTGIRSDSRKNGIPKPVYQWTVNQEQLSRRRQQPRFVFELSDLRAMGTILCSSPVTERLPGQRR